jgi:7,8-dihydropterin-6-yl-methyl-4-(beta-D-ribofuranosyl)aminobenzene 5'-phosphate synthase
MVPDDAGRRCAVIKVTCVVDNAVYSHEPLWAEQGVAFLIETDEGRVLFDTGWSGTVLLHNLELLGVDPSTIDAVALSHAHYDHSGGLSALLGWARGTPLYAHPDLLRGRYTLRNGSIKPVGLPVGRQDLEAQMALRLSAEATEILPGVWTTGEIQQRPEPEGRAEHDLVREHSQWKPDPYYDDMAMVLDTGDGLAVLCGCCHAGLTNTLLHVQRVFGKQITSISGGTHLVSSDRKNLTRVIDALREVGISRLYPNHCTGQQAYVALVEAFGNRVAPCTVGTILNFPGTW